MPAIKQEIRNERVTDLLTHILIADDDPVYREVARDALEEAGHKVTLACDGAEAMTCLSQTAFHAAIIDLTMPKADGIAVIEAARKGGPNAMTPIVVITGHDDTSAVEGAYRAGATSFLTKPLNWVLFTPHINFVLRSGQAENELRETTKAAAFLSELKSQMMSALAREFQQPIKTIFGCSELMRKEAFGPLTPATYREMALDMGAAAQRLNASFLKLMDHGNALNEQLELKVERIPVAETVSNILSSIFDLADRRHVAIEQRVEIAPDASIDADRALFVQAVRSVVSNAVKLSPRGSKVEIRLWTGDDETLKISAHDHGPAVSSSLLAELQRAPNQRAATSNESESRDVGIKIAKVLTEAHRGRLDIQADASGNLVRLEFPQSRRGGAARVAIPVASVPAAPVSADKPRLQSDRLAVITAALAKDPRVRLGQAGVPAEVAVGQSETIAVSAPRLRAQT